MDNSENQEKSYTVLEAACHYENGVVFESDYYITKNDSTLDLLRRISKQEFDGVCRYYWKEWASDKDFPKDRDIIKLSQITSDNAVNGKQDDEKSALILGDERLTELKKQPNFIFHQLRNRNEEISFNTGFHRGFEEGIQSAKLVKANSELVEALIIANKWFYTGGDEGRMAYKTFSETLEKYKK